MSFNNSTPLLIYKASAGSGKTYTLTKEYIQLLFQIPVQEEKIELHQALLHYEDAYKHILAVTFTKKATAEMKQRIIKEISILANDTNKSAYLNDIINTIAQSVDIKTAKPQQVIQLIEKRAQKILRTLLIDYSNFNVKTIDAFFQQILRAFARDLGLNDQFTIEMDTDSVLESAIDYCFTHLDIHSPEGRSIKEMMLEKIQNQQSWNPKNDITGLAKEIFKEAYHSKASELEDIDYKTVIKELSSDIHTFEKEIKSLCDTIQQTVPNLATLPLKRGLLSNITYDSLIKEKCILKKSFTNIAKEIDLQNNLELLEAFSNPKSWISAANLKKNPEFVDIFNSSFAQACTQLFLTLHASNPELLKYHSQVAIKKKIHVLSLLNSIHSIINEQLKQGNRQLISNTNDLIHNIIDGSDTPFIYEKTGVKISHYFIDEFQDTSNMQWKNFKPLLQESLSSYNTNLLVGDVKQSIYRWRSSDYRILHEIENDPQLQSYIDPQNMYTNWRSTENVIRFNNVLFTSILKNDSLYDSSNTNIENIYQDVNQLPNNAPKNLHNGLIKIVCPNEKIKEAAVFKHLMLSHIVGEIDFLISEKNYHFSDIMILVRKNAEAQEVVKFLMEQRLSNGSNIPVISNEALMLKNSQAIQLIIASLRFILNPNETIRFANLLMLHEVCNNTEDTVTINPIEKIDIPHLLSKDNQNWENTLKKDILSYANFPLFKLIESLIQLFKLSQKEHELPYLMAFQDIIIEYTKNHSSDIFLFLNDWDNYYANHKALAAPNNINAIQILSIHKSKGLESKALFVPFVDWSLKPKPREILWSNQENQSPEYQSPLPVSPVEMSAHLKNTTFAKEYQEEEQNTLLDTLNLTYVAFTRAAEYLFIGTPRKDYTGNSSHMGDYIMQVIDTIDECSQTLVNKVTTQFHHETLTDGQALYLLPECKIEDITQIYEKDEEYELSQYSIGQLQQHQPETENSEENNILKMEYPTYSIDQKTRPGLQLKGSSNYWDTDNSAKNYGTMMHDCLSHIYSSDDLSDAAHHLFTNGLITEKEESMIVEELTPVLQNPEIIDWFTPEKYHRILREQALYSKPLKSYKNQTEFRPDRVLIKDNQAIIIDYKFGKKSKTHIQQVQAYKDIYQQKGFEASGYLLYIKNKKATIVEV